MGTNHGDLLRCEVDGVKHDAARAAKLHTHTIDEHDIVKAIARFRDIFRLKAEGVDGNALRAKDTVHRLALNV